MTLSRHKRGTRALSSAVACILCMTVASAPVMVTAEPAEHDEAAIEGSDDAASDDEPDDESTLPEQRQDVRVQVAERHYVDGMVAFNRGRYGEAAAQFERSYAAISAARTLYSIGLSLERAGRTIAAIEAYERYLALPDCTDPGADTLRCAEQRKEVARSVDKLRSFVGELQLDLSPNVKLREIRVAGRVVPLEDFPLLLMPGPTEVELYGLEPEDHRVRLPRITAGEVYVLRVTPFVRVPPPRLEPDKPPVPDLSPRELEAQRRRTAMMKRGFWAGVGVTLASGATTGMVAGFTRREKGLYERDKCVNPCPDDPTHPDWRPYPLERNKRFHALRTTTNVMIGVTAAFGLATVVVGALAFSRRDRSAQRANVQLTGNGLTVRW
jgi:hypothetical protein